MGARPRGVLMGVLGGGDEGRRKKLQNQEDVLKATVALRRPCRSGLPAGSATTSADSRVGLGFQQPRGRDFVPISSLLGVIIPCAGSGLEL